MSETTTSKQKTTRKPRSAEDLKSKIEKLQAQLIKTEQTENINTLTEQLQKHNIVSAFENIKKDTNIDYLVILTALGKALNIPRLSITQTPIKPRSTSTTKKGVGKK